MLTDDQLKKQWLQDARQLIRESLTSRSRSLCGDRRTGLSCNALDGKLVPDPRMCPPKGCRLVTKDPSDFFPVDWDAGCIHVPPVILPVPLTVDSSFYLVFRKHLVEAILRAEKLQCGGLINPAEFEDAFSLMQDLLVAYRAKHQELHLHVEAARQITSFVQAMNEHKIDSRNEAEVARFAKFFRVNSTADMLQLCANDAALMCSLFLRAFTYVKHPKDLPTDWQALLCEYASPVEDVQRFMQHLRRLQDATVVGREEARRNTNLDKGALVDLNWLRVTERMLSLAFENTVLQSNTLYRVSNIDATALNPDALRPVQRRADQIILKYAMYPLFPHIAPCWFAAQYVEAYNAALASCTANHAVHQDTLPGHRTGIVRDILHFVRYPMFTQLFSKSEWQSLLSRCDLGLPVPLESLKTMAGFVLDTAAKIKEDRQRSYLRNQVWAAGQLQESAFPTTVALQYGPEFVHLCQYQRPVKRRANRSVLLTEQAFSMQYKTRTGRTSQ